MESFKGMQVAITGRLASMSRAGAVEWIRARGGQYVASVNRQTSMLVVGQESWPIQPDGKLTLSLQKAQQLQQRGHPITILAETEWVSRFNLNDQSEGVHRLYTLAQLIDLLKGPKQRVRAWLQAGLIQPVEEVHGVCYFDFRQVVGAKTLCELANAGVSTDSIKRSLEQLKVWMADADQPLNQLAWLEKNGQLLVRLEEGLVEPSGQLYFDFGEDQVITHQTPYDSAEQWFKLGCQHEQEGFLAEAVHAYRQTLQLGGPDADASFNMANVLYELGQKAEACERYRQVLEMNQPYAEAWNNLGIVLADLEQFEDAVEAYRQAIDLDYADAHFNLAKLLETLDRKSEAHEHWRAYLRYNPQGPWGKYARSRLG